MPPTRATRHSCANDWCLTPFYASHPQAKYCSDSCRQWAYRERKTGAEVKGARDGVPAVAVTAEPQTPVTVLVGAAVTDSRAYTDRPVPIASPYWNEKRFWGFSGDPWEDDPWKAPLPGRTGTGDNATLLLWYVLDIARIGELMTWKRHYEPQPEGWPYDVEEPLPDELPADITPEIAAHLFSWLEPALDRAAELLDLLDRRSVEDWDDDEAAAK